MLTEFDWHCENYGADVGAVFGVKVAQCCGPPTVLHNDSIRKLPIHGRWTGDAA